MSDFRFHQGELDRLMADEHGMVGRMILRKTLAVERAAKHLCPVDTGRLRSSIQSHLEREARTVVGIVGTNVEYAAYIEFGTMPHVIRARDKKVLANKKTGQFFGKVVHHPGTDAQPFLRPALQAARGD